MNATAMETNMYRDDACQCDCKDSSGKPKRRYETQREAQWVMEVRQRDGAGYLRWYPCPTGNGFHLTSKEDTRGYWY